jgi:outer membrane protein assembly factor BamB
MKKYCGDERLPIGFGVMKRLSGIVGAGLLMGSSLCAESWPQFRGANASAAIDGASIPLEWSADKNLKWKTLLPGPGSSSPIFWGNKLFVTCYVGYGVNPKEIGKPENLGRQLLCLDRETGKILWRKSVELANPEDDYRGYIMEHGYASATPVTDGKHVYTFFGKSGVHAFTMDGEKVWSKEVGKSSSNRRWGSAASPILLGNLLIVNASDESMSIIAFDKNSGEEKWTYGSPQLELTYNTPMIHELTNGRVEVVIAAPDELLALDPKTGKKLWFAKTGISGNISPSVVSEGDVLFTTGGYPKKGAIAIKGGGTGDVTDQILWKSKSFSYVPSPVVKDGLVYWVNDEADAYVMDLKTGETVTKNEVEGIAKSRKMSFYASALRVADKFIVTSRKNGVFVFEAGKEMKQIGQNHLGDESDFNATPALSKDSLYLRSNEAIYCIAK